MNEEKRKKKGFEKLLAFELIPLRKGTFVLARGRKPERDKREQNKLISIRLPKSLLKKIDDYVEGYELEERSLAIRYLLNFALATIEKFEAGEIMFKEKFES